MRVRERKCVGWCGLLCGALDDDGELAVRANLRVARSTCHLFAYRKALRARTDPSWVGPLSFETLKMRTPAGRKSS